MRGAKVVFCRKRNKYVKKRKSLVYISVFHTGNKEWNSSNSSKSKKIKIVQITCYFLAKQLCDAISTVTYNVIYNTIYIILTRFIKLNVWYYDVTHSYEVDYRLLNHISSYLYEIFMELFQSRQNDQITPVFDTCGWRCVVTPSTKIIIGTRRIIIGARRKFERVENTMVMVRKEIKEMRDLLIEKVEKSMAGKLKEMGKECAGTSKRNDDGSTPENGDGSKRDKIYHREHEKRN